MMLQIPMLLQSMGLDCSYENLIVTGDSVGGGLARAMTLLAKYEKGLKIDKQLLFYSGTNDDFKWRIRCFA